MKWIRRITLISLFLIIGINLESGNIPVVILLNEKPNEDKLLKAIMQVESNYNTEIINYSENAAGILQIRPICVREVNRILSIQGDENRFSMNDRMDSVKSVQMWYIIQGYHNPDYDPMLAARIWNGGTKRYKEMSHQYWLKVKKQYDLKY